jgi:hypothetical protein
MIMDVRSLETPKARKTGVWSFATIGSVYSDSIAAAFHEETQVIAYCANMHYTQKLAEGSYWYNTTLAWCDLKMQVNRDIDRDPRGVYNSSESCSLGKVSRSFWAIGAGGSCLSRSRSLWLVALMLT